MDMKKIKDFSRQGLLPKEILNADIPRAVCGTLKIDHASDYIFCFIQTSTSDKQTVEAKYKFE